MKKLILAYILCSTVVSAQQPKWAKSEAWLKLQPYMTTQQVTKLLGDPVDREVSLIAQQWYYQEEATRVQGKVTERPTCGFVRFKTVKIDPITKKRLRQPVFVVASFEEPDWSRVSEDTPQTEATRIRPDRKLEQQQRLEERKAKAEKRRAEFLESKEQQQQEEQERIKERNRQRVDQLAARPKTEPKKTIGFNGKYFLIVGGVLFIAAVAVAMTKRAYT